jgi:hypothetical protein
VLDAIALCDPDRLTRRNLNDQVIAAHPRPGQGMFVAALRRGLRRRGLIVPLQEHHLIAKTTS